jgi:hypothetical protein
MRKMNRYLLLADGAAVFHSAYVAFVTIGFALITAGIVMRWEWVLWPIVSPHPPPSSSTPLALSHYYTAPN